MGCSSSQEIASPTYRLPKIWKEDPSDYPSMTPLQWSEEQYSHLQPFFALKARISKSRHDYKYPQGDLGLLTNTKPQSEPHPPGHLTEAQFHLLNRVISHATDLGISREETYGPSHLHTLHSFLIAGTAYFHLGHKEEALPLLEQVYILSELKSCAEQTIQAAEILNYYYYKEKNFDKRLQALEKKGVHPKLR